jgi:TatD DNase family protein
MWIDAHCHLDAAEFDADRTAVVGRARAAGVRRLVLPAVAPEGFETVRELAHAHDAVYALGIHPLWAERVGDTALLALQTALDRWRGDPRLVAVGEIGLDHAVVPPPAPRHTAAERTALAISRERQWTLYVAQLKLARAAGLPVILHVRRSADALLQGLNRVPVAGGIAHAFNGSQAQAARFVGLGFKLGFGGAMSFERAVQIRHLAASLPAEALVLETDAPDIPPQWLYRTAAERSAGQPQGRNEPAELPRIGAVLAGLRGWSLAQTAARTAANTAAALPKLGRLDPVAVGLAATAASLGAIA